MNKVIICIFLVIPFVLNAAGSFRYKEELRPILEQRMDLLWLLEQSFQFEESGSAGRIGQLINSNLGGKRVGPYTILAQSKGMNKIFWYEITIHTEKTYLDSTGSSTNIRQAVEVSESFISVDIKPIDFTKNQVPTSR
jgi:hypothetical protein